MDDWILDLGRQRYSSYLLQHRFSVKKARRFIMLEGAEIFYSLRKVVYLPTTERA
jgi:hypothetical protein